MSERYNWPHDGWWENKERYAQELTEAELIFAIGEDLISWHNNQADTRREFTRRCSERTASGYMVSPC